MTDITKIYIESDPLFKENLHPEDKEIDNISKGIIIKTSYKSSFYAGFKEMSKIGNKTIYECLWRIEGRVKDLLLCVRLAFSLLNKGDILLGSCFYNKNGRASSILAHRFGFETVKKGEFCKIIRKEV